MFSHHSFNLKLAICCEFQAPYRLATWLAIYFISNPLTKGPVEIS